MLRYFCLAALALSLPLAAQAQDPSDGAKLLECRAVAKGSARLKCYDEALDEMYGVDEELQARRDKDKRDRFGLPVDDDGMQLTELTATITEVDINMRNNITFLALDNGQVWELLSSGGLRARMKPGMEIIISESRTGGYRLRIPDKNGFRGVNRVR